MRPEVALILASRVGFSNSDRVGGAIRVGRCQIGLIGIGSGIPVRHPPAIVRVVEGVVVGSVITDHPTVGPSVRGLIGRIRRAEVHRDDFGAEREGCRGTVIDGRLANVAERRQPVDVILLDVRQDVVEEISLLVDSTVLRSRSISAERRELVVCRMVVVQANPNLLQVVLTLGPSGGFAHFLNGREQESDENRDDRDDDEQFDQRKAGRTPLQGKAYHVALEERGN